MFIPPGFTTVTPYLIAQDAERLMEFLLAGLGGVQVLVHLRPDGRIGNGQVRIGQTTLMLSEASEAYPATPACFYLYVEDAHATLARAIAHGAVLESAIADQVYGDRQGGVRDAHGNIWWIAQRLVDGPYG